MNVFEERYPEYWRITFDQLGTNMPPRVVIPECAFTIKTFQLQITVVVKPVDNLYRRFTGITLAGVTARQQADAQG